MVQMSRLQRLLTIYLLYKLSKPRIIEKVDRRYGGGGISLSEADDRYVNVAGDTMTGNLNVDTHSILFDHVLLKPYSTTALQVRNIADTDFASLVAMNLIAQGAINAVGIGNYGGYVLSETGIYSNLFRPESELSDMVFRTGSGAGKVTLQAYDSFTLMLEDVGELNDGAVTLFRAGDITFKANKTLKVGNISATGTPTTQTKYIPVDDGGTTRYIMLHDSVS